MNNGKVSAHGAAHLGGPLRCALYVRVSTDRQAAKEFSSLDAQEDVLRQLVAGKNSTRPPGEPEWTIVNVFREKASAKDTNRPEFQRLLREVEEGRVNMIVFIRLDRFSRSLRDFLDLQDFLRKHGCGYVSRYDPMLDTSSPHGEFVVHLLLLLAEYERKLVGARTREKVAAARRRGRWCGGFIPLGFDLPKNEKRLVVNEKEAETVRDIFRQFLELQSLTALVTELNRKGWTTKSWTTQDGREWGGLPWTKGTLQRLLSNRNYIAQVRHGKDFYPAEHEAIIDEGLFKRVQEMLGHGRSHGPHGNSYGYLLRGLIICKACGSSMTPATTKKKRASYRYYRCTAVEKKGTDACPVRYVPAEPLEAFVVDHLRRLSREPQLVEETLQEAHRQIKVAISGLAGERRRLEAEIRRIQVEARRVLSSKATGSLATGHLAELEERQGTIASRLAEIEAESRKLAEVQIDPEKAKEALALFDPVWGVLEPRERERLVRLVVERVEYDGTRGEIEVTFQPLGLGILAKEVGRVPTVVAVTSRVEEVA